MIEIFLYFLLSSWRKDNYRSSWVAWKKYQKYYENVLSQNWDLGVVNGNNNLEKEKKLQFLTMDKAQNVTVNTFQFLIQ